MKQKNKPASLDELKRRLAQVDALIADGTLKGPDAQETRARLEREVLAQVGGGGGAAAAAPASRPSGRLMLVIGGFVLLFGLGGYAWLGNPGALNVSPGSAPTAAQAEAHGADPAQIAAMIKSLADRLKAHPEDAEGWAMLGRSYTAQGQYDDALAAFRKVVALKPHDGQALADLADAVAVKNNRSLEGEPEKLIAQAVEADPDNVKALALAGTVAYNHADYKKAVGYWEHAVSVSDPASDFTKELKGALDEARQRAGMPPLAAASGAAGNGVADAAPAEAAAPATAAAADSGASITGRVTIKAALKSQLPADATVFIFARAPGGPPMPIAALRRTVGDLPTDFRLDDSQAMNPAMKLSSFPQVVVSARVSKSGSPMPAPGDYQVVSAPVKVGTQGLQLEIADLVK